MANLNFKWGNHANLPAQLSADQIGSLFFTKDEGALYLGVEAGKKPQRIQGVVQYYADLAAFKADVLPPYSSDVIYYIASENALVKWKEKKAASGDTAATSGEFIVLNVTASEFNSTVVALSTDIAGNAADIAAVDSAVDALAADLGEKGAAAGDTTAFARIKQLENAVEALEELTGTGSGENSLSARIAALETWQATASTDIAGLKTDVAGHTTTIGSHTTKIEALETFKTNAEKDLTTIKSNISDLQGEDTAIKNRLTTAENGLNTANNNITQLTTDLSGLAGRVSTNEKNITNLQNDLSTANGKIDDLAEWKKTASNTIANHTSSINTINGQITTINGDIDAINGDIGELNRTTSKLRTDLGTNDKTDGSTAFTRIKALETASSAANTAATQLAGRVDTLEGTVTGHGTAIKDLQDSVQNITEDIADINGVLATKADNSTVNALTDRVDGHDTAIENIGTRIDGVDDEIDAIQEAIAADGPIQSAIKQNATDIAAHGKTLENHTSSINTINNTLTDHGTRIKANEDAIAAIKSVNNEQGTAIAGLDTRLDTAEADIKQLQTDVGANAKSIGDLANDLDANYYTKTEADGLHTNLKTELENKLTSHINAANALVYIGGVGSVSEWNTIKAKDAAIGHTYVVTSSGLTLNINGTDEVCYAGDLLIATAANPADEVNNVLPANKIQWVVVESGYNEELATTMRVVDGDGADAHKKASIQLSSYTGAAANNHGDLGKIHIVSASNNLNVDVSGENISITMVWDEF